MFYEEKIIDGVLHSRSSPAHDFKPLTQAELTALLMASRWRLKELELARVPA